VKGERFEPRPEATGQAGRRVVLEQCKRQEVAFFFKQWGGVVKKKAGRELLGRTWDEFPRKIAELRPQLRLPFAATGTRERLRRGEG